MAVTELCECFGDSPRELRVAEWPVKSRSMSSQSSLYIVPGRETVEASMRFLDGVLKDVEIFLQSGNRQWRSRSLAQEWKCIPRNERCGKQKSQALRQAKHSYASKWLPDFDAATWPKGLKLLWDTES